LKADIIESAKNIFPHFYFANSKTLFTFAVAMLKLTSHIVKEILPDNAPYLAVSTIFLNTHTHTYTHTHTHTLYFKLRARTREHGTYNNNIYTTISALSFFTEKNQSGFFMPSEVLAENARTLANNMRSLVKDESIFTGRGVAAS
jgi:hypothetical protein